jgi:hypothetical protein
MVRANVQVIEAVIVGPAESYIGGTPSLDDNNKDVFEYADAPWPSDHKAVSATFRLGITR